MNFTDSLTRREREVTREVTVGKTNREIAGTLFISVNTVQTHISSILKKTGMESRTQLAILTIQNNLLENH